MDRKSLEKLIGQDVAYVWRRPRNRTPWTADRVKLVAVGVAGGWIDRYAADSADRPADVGRFILVEAEDGRRRRIESRSVYSSWDDFVALREREKVAAEAAFVRAEARRAEDEAFRARLHRAAKAVGLSESEWDVGAERRYDDEYRVSIGAGVKLVELLESLAVGQYEAAQER